MNPAEHAEPDDDADGLPAEVPVIELRPAPTWPVQRFEPQWSGV